MPAVVLLRPDFDATKLREVAKRCPDSRQTARLLALAAVYDGMNRAEAAKVGGMAVRRCAIGFTGSTRRVWMV